MSMLEFSVTPTQERAVEFQMQVGKIGLANVVSIEPAFDAPEGFFAPAAKKNQTLVIPLHKIGDKSLLLAVVSDKNEAAEAKISQTIEDIHSLVNIAHDPAAGLEVMYRTAS